MGVLKMKGFFEPNSIAVVGASSNPNKGGFDLVSNLKERFEARLYPVNPTHQEICGIPCFRSVSELPCLPDLAILFVNAEAVPSILEECGRKGIQRVMIQSAGFSETGEHGAKLQQQCVSLAKEYGMRLWGPNCMGIVDARSGIVASFMRTHIWRGRLRPGSVSLIVQSGMLTAGFLIQILSEKYFGLSKACSIGNRCDVNECDILEYLAEDPTTEVVVLYLESIADVPRFRAAVATLKRPVVLLKGGVSAEGARAARSHTGSLAGNASLAEGFFRQMRIHRAQDFMEMVDLARALAHWRGKTTGKRMAVLTFSGASGIVASDHFEKLGLTISPLSQTTLDSLGEIFPAWVVPRNPVDIWPAIEKVGREAYGRALGSLGRDPLVDGIYIHLYVDRTLLPGILQSLSVLKSIQKRAAVWVIGDASCFGILREHVEPFGVPVYTEVGRGARALSLLAESDL
jgi:acetate---CoA ligase (ADP-forming)